MPRTAAPARLQHGLAEYVRDREATIPELSGHAGATAFVARTSIRSGERWCSEQRGRHQTGARALREVQPAASQPGDTRLGQIR